ncbi:Protein of unknown function [Pyronema omphalodes CBS 100304]|uniref:Uncharacterized protein n=1 Tax=Pyronema omphalodes (strain CBS 100304) TaxID=1076935 RepID=U4KTR5_PYROM|nr:Protein of unknown function [Pyronema omphalodes CBS 100304]
MKTTINRVRELESGAVPPKFSRVFGALLRHVSPLRMANTGTGYCKTGFVEDMGASEDEGGGISLE